MDIRNQLKDAAPILVVLYALTTAILSVVIFIGIENNVQSHQLTQDPAAILNTPFYLGFFSYIGILFWCATSVICFFTRSLIAENPSQIRVKHFLLYSGLISGLLLFDDLFMFHENVLPVYFSLPKNVVYLIYINIILVYVIMFRSELLISEYIILIIASGLIGISQFVDLIPMPIPEDSFLEDAVKLFGIVTWFTYYMRYCYKTAKENS
ncbi:MAG: hypothetical protein IPP71_09025 [Bacteroidetes bacterium]|nr:hypothetical protein [Bacteroidota bacterium]